MPTNLSNGQYWLIKTIASLNYKTDNNGLCDGQSLIAIQSFLGKEFEKYESRRRLIYDLFLKSLEEAKKILNISFEESQELDLMLDVDLETVSVQSTVVKQKLLDLQEALQKQIVINFNMLSNNDRNDLYAFFDGVTVKHFTQNGLTFFGVNENDILSIILSKKLEEEGGISIVDSIAISSSNVEEMSYYFKSLRSSIDNSQVPIAMELSCNKLKDDYLKHVIAVMYDPLRSLWLFSDPNQLQTDEVTDENMLSKKVLGAFTKNEKTSFVLKILATNKNNEKIKQNINEWKIKLELELNKRKLRNFSLPTELIKQLKKILSFEFKLENEMNISLSNFKKIVEAENDNDRINEELHLFKELGFNSLIYNTILVLNEDIQKHENMQNIMKQVIISHEKYCQEYSETKAYSERVKVVSNFLNFMDTFNNEFEAKLDEITSPVFNSSFLKK